MSTLSTGCCYGNSTEGILPQLTVGTCTLLSSPDDCEWSVGGWESGVWEGGECGRVECGVWESGVWESRVGGWSVGG